MKGALKKINFLFVFAVLMSLFLPLSFFWGCASTKTVQIQKKIQAMSDIELVGYYHGINDRIRKIDREAEVIREDSRNSPEKDVFDATNPFIAYQEGQNLLNKRKIVVKEMNRRGISP